MSEVFAKPEQRNNKPSPNAETIPRLLEENSYLLTVITEQFNKGKLSESIELQKKLHRNLVYLACLAYPNASQNKIAESIPVRYSFYLFVLLIFN